MSDNVVTLTDHENGTLVRWLFPKVSLHLLHNLLRWHCHRYVPTDTLDTLMAMQPLTHYTEHYHIMFMINIPW